MLRKGILEAGLGEIILTVLVAAVISGAMFGPLGAQMGEGFKEAEEFTDVKTTVTVDDKETLGDLSQYVFYRAWGCDQVEDTTFDGLKSTSLTDDGEVPCAGAGSTVAKGATDILKGNTGNDMEGKYSRINFVINDTITLKTGEGFGPQGDGKDAVLLGISTGDRFGKAGYSDWIWSGCTAYSTGVGDAWGGSWESKGPPYSFHTLFFKNGGGESRIEKHGNGATIEDRYDSGGQNDPLYCDEWNDGPWLTKPSSKTGNPKDHSSTGGNYVEVKLCPGDKGYIETRKAYPNIEGETDGSLASDNNDNLYSMIQITDMNSSCGTSSTDSGGGTAPLNPEPDAWPDDSVYTVTGNTVDIDTGTTSDAGIFRWDNLNSGSDEINISVVYSDILELENSYIRKLPATGSAHLEFDKDGDNKVHMICNSCSGAGDTGVKLEEGKRYSFLIRESGSTTEFEISREGSEVFSSGSVGQGYDTLVYGLGVDTSSRFNMDVKRVG